MGDARSDLIPAALLLALGLMAGGCTGSIDPEEAAVQSGVVPSPSGTSTQPTNGDAPTVSLSADALTVGEGGSTTLRWSATNADSCTASGGWGGTVATSGSMSVGPLDAGTTFSLSCSGPGGSALEMLAVAVEGPVALSWIAPDQNVDGSPLTDLAGYRIYYGQESRSYSDMVELGSPGATSYTLTLASGDYYVAMTALDGQGNESAYSNEVLKTRL